MEHFEEVRKLTPTPEEIVERINRCLEQWAAEEREEAARRKEAQTREQKSGSAPAP